MRSVAPAYLQEPLTSRQRSIIEHHLPRELKKSYLSRFFLEIANMCSGTLWRFGDFNTVVLVQCHITYSFTVKVRLLKYAIETDGDKTPKTPFSAWGT